MKNIFILLSVFTYLSICAQNITVHPSGISINENYVYSRTYLDSTTTSTTSTKQVQSVSYFDGLGRAKQSVAIKASPTGKDLVTTIPYDGFGRQLDSWLHAPMTSLNGGIQTGVEGATTGFYGDTNPYSQKVLENSPLDRIQKQIQVGQDWSAKPVTFDYLAVQATDLVKKYTFTTGWGSDGATTFTIPTSTIYADNTLYKNSVKDEDGSETIEFKNGRGQTILVRKVLSSTENADTYYVYNDYDQLTYVISPLASVKITLSQTDLDNLCYQYRYDGKNRLVEKKLPGKGSEFMVYDQQDRLVLTQDANLRLINNNFKATGWLFTKYDKFGRVAYTGFFPNGAKRVSMQNALSNMRQNAPNNEERTTSPTVVLQNMPLYYNNEAFPTGSKTLLTINYYDTYPVGTPIPSDNKIQNVPILQEVVSTGVSQTTKSLPTASFIKNIEDDNWTKNYSFYDRKGRVIGSHSINHLGGYTKTESILDFTGIPQNIFTDHKRLHSDPEVKIKETFSYDHQNRLLVHKHQVNNQSPEILAENTYNEIGQLDYKKVGNNIQKINYAYNIRGWMTKINDPSNLGNKLFAYQIRYDSPKNSVIAPKKFNGNISEVDWITSNDQSLRRYSYTYDKLNRLLGATYQKPTEVIPLTKSYNEELSYDVNGNILTLKRYGGMDYFKAQKIDDLTYKYNGNQLHSVTDSSSNYLGYPDISGNTIAIDSNGNMTNNKDKGINLIEYNYSNLITGLLFEETYIPNPYSRPINARTTYLYDSNGTKLRKTRYTGVKASIGETIEITDYLTGFHYLAVTTDDGNNNINITPPTLQFIPTAEGYYDFLEKSYIYNYVDHLGNIRLSYGKNQSTGKVNVLEENNYYAFGLKHEGYNDKSISTSYNYKYNGKELQETGMYDYGARMYMPDIGRWGVVDPLAEKYPNMSPYNYVANNPVMFVDPDGKDFGVRIDHKNHTIVIEANYYYQNQDGYDKNKGSLAQWNSLGASYTTADGVEYAVSFDVKGVVAEDGQNVQDLASNDPIGNSVQELSDNGYLGWVGAVTGSESKTQEHMDNQGGGATARGKNIANKSSVANDKTRTHEMGHTFGQGENAGGVMDYAESFDKMSNANFTNTKSVMKGVYNKVKSDKNSLNNDGSMKSGTVGKSNFRIIVSGTYSGEKGFLKPKKVNEK